MPNAIDIATLEEQKPYPITFCYVFVEYGHPEAAVWLQYWKAAISHTYPDCAWATLPYQTPQSSFVAARCQAYAKMRQLVRGNLVFLDVDCLAYSRCDPFVDDFDIGLTTSEKTWPLMPFNGGVIFSKDTPGAQAFFDRVKEGSNNIAEGMQDWWLDQLSMRLAYDQMKDDKVKFKIFPHEMYNFVPDGPQATDAYFVHCKGDRKYLLRQYLATILGTDHFKFHNPNIPRQVT